MRGLGVALLLPTALIIVLWLIGRAVGYEVSLIGSLGLSVVLTLILNLVLRSFRGRRNYRP